MYLPSCLPIPDANTTDTLFGVNISSHLYLGKNARMRSPTTRSFHYRHYYCPQRHRGHVLAQNDKLQAQPSP